MREDRHLLGCDGAKRVDREGAACRDARQVRRRAWGESEKGWAFLRRATSLKGRCSKKSGARGGVMIAGYDLTSERASPTATRFSAKRARREAGLHGGRRGGRSRTSKALEGPEIRVPQRRRRRSIEGTGAARGGQAPSPLEVVGRDGEKPLSVMVPPT